MMYYITTYRFSFFDIVYWFYSMLDEELTHFYHPHLWITLLLTFVTLAIM